MYAIIDVGSNTVRMNIYKLERGQLSLVMGKKESVGLASYVKNGQMLPEGVNRACEVLAEFRMILQDLGITDYHVFATAALRNAVNSRAAVAEIMERTGIKIEVISGETEAELDFIGASHAVEVTDGLLVDIGGASTELVVYAGGEIKKKVSLPIGSLNTYDRYVTNLLPSRTERKAIRQMVLNLLKQDTDLYEGEYIIVCGVGGTIRAGSRAYRAAGDDHSLHADQALPQRMGGSHAGRCPRWLPLSIRPRAGRGPFAAGTSCGGWTRR